MTKAEEELVQWAFNLTDAIVAGDYKIPRPMIWALNHLQDAAWTVAKERDSTPAGLASEEYLKVKRDYWAEVERKLQSSN